MDMTDPRTQMGGYDQTTPFQKWFLNTIAALAAVGMLCWSMYVYFTKWLYNWNLCAAGILLLVSAGITVYMFFTKFDEAKDRIQDHMILVMVLLGVVAMTLPELTAGYSKLQGVGFRFTILFIPLTLSLVLCGKMFIRGAMANSSLVTQLGQENQALQAQVQELEQALQGASQNQAGEPDEDDLEDEVDEDGLDQDADKDEDEDEDETDENGEVKTTQIRKSELQQGDLVVYSDEKLIEVVGIPVVTQTHISFKGCVVIRATGERGPAKNYAWELNDEKLLVLVPTN